MFDDTDEKAIEAARLEANRQMLKLFLLVPIEGVIFAIAHQLLLFVILYLIDPNLIRL